MKVVTIGRSSDNTVVLPDAYVSSYHCQITQEDSGAFYLSDRNSMNGTFVNGRRITGEVSLSPADVVRIGSITLPWQSYFGGGGNRGGYTKVQEGNIGGGQSGYAPPGSSKPKPDNFLVWSIICTFLCCLPFGIASIVNSSKVNGLWDAGDYAGAEKALSNAKMWFWWSFGVGIFSWIISIIYMIIVVGVASNMR